MKAYLTGRRALAAAVLVVMVVVGAILLQSGGSAKSRPLTNYTAIVSAIKGHTAKSARLDTYDGTIRVYLHNGTQLYGYYPGGDEKALVADLLAAKVPVQIPPPPPSSTLGKYLPSIIMLIAMAALLSFYLRKTMNIGALKDGGRAVKVPSTRLGDIAGYQHLMPSLTHVLRQFTDPADFSRLGARPLSGLLLVGPPGTGKTLIAKAMAGEAQIPVYELSGSSFVEKVAGVGPSRIRQVFKSARKHKRAILFIDEIDAIGRARGGVANDTSEREATLNQLLSEMNGFKDRSNILVIGATNRVELLDPALIRPGRFDRQIHVDLPDHRGRQEILEMYWAKLPHTEPIDLDLLSSRTVGMSGADLSNLVNEAALAAAQDGCAVVTQQHLLGVMTDVSLGPRRPWGMPDPLDRQIAAIHEAGHTVAAMFQPELSDPLSVSIIPRAGSGGHTNVPDLDRAFVTSARAFQQLVMLLAGRAAEIEQWGEEGFTQGASGDLKAATELATNMVTKWGMGSKSLAYMAEVDDDARQQIDLLLQNALTKAQGLVQSHWTEIQHISHLLQERGDLDRDALAAIKAAAPSGQASTL